MNEKKYRLDERVYDIYFQKSYKFIFPLLKVKADVIKPAQTFLTWGEIVNREDYMLVCVYDLVESVEYKKFENKDLFGNPYFEDFRIIEENKGAYIFNLHKFKDDINHFYNGQYSLFSEESKKTILQYYSPNIYSRQYIDSYLNPEKYFKLYADLLDVPEEIVRSSGELCDKYNESKERLHLKEIVLNFQINSEI